MLHPDFPNDNSIYGHNALSKLGNNSIVLWMKIWKLGKARLAAEASGEGGNLVSPTGTPHTPLGQVYGSQEYQGLLESSF